MQAIKAAYVAQYRRPLLEVIKKCMSGEWEKALLARCLDKPTYYATTLEAAFDGLGTDERAVSRILGRSSKADLRHIAARYEELFGRPLKEAIQSETSGSFKKALITSLFEEAPGQKFAYEE